MYQLPLHHPAVNRLVVLLRVRRESVQPKSPMLEAVVAVRMKVKVRID